MPKRDFVHTTDFERADYEEVLHRAKVFDAGVQAGKDFTHLLPGRVLASMFFKESTRTMTSFQAAMVRLGGGWTGLTGVSGTYLGTGEEDIGDIVESVAEVSDIMVLRYNDCDPVALAKQIGIPLMNGMCGGDEHATGALAMMYPFYKQWGTLQGKTIGLYGMVSSSRPMKAIVSAMGTFGVHFVIDPVVDVFKFPQKIYDLAIQRGATIEYTPMDEWIGDVDGIVWVEGLPQTGEPQENVDAFNSQFHQFVPSDLGRIRADALLTAVMPRMTTDGRLTVVKECDADPRNVSFALLRQFQFGAMGLITYLLDVDV
jgi:aspartate carbamoyltransferase catalytic subunit